MISYSESTLKNLDSRYRANLVNSLTGFKCTVLIGTKNSEGKTNLAIFSQVMHIGANPPMIGVLFRPETVGRHTLANIRESGFFTLNHINPHIVEAAHASSAKWEISEFEALKLTPELMADFDAPFVAESNIQIGLQLNKEYLLDVNNTILLVGDVKLIRLKDDYVLNDGFVDIHAANTITCNGLDAYYEAKPLIRYDYARPGTEAKQIPIKKPIESDPLT